MPQISRSDRPLVTIAIPVLNEARLLPGLLDAISSQTWPRAAMEIFIVDGGSRDATPQLANAAGKMFPNFTLISNRKVIAAAGLNRALAMARGQYFVRFDARSRPAPEYVEQCVKHLDEGVWAGVGGAQFAIGENKRGQAIALALNHPLGAGKPSYRRRHYTGESKTLYLGAYPIDWLKRIGGWDEHFAANEDYELNMRLRTAGGRLLVASDMMISYVARDSFQALIQQYFRYGCWRFVTWRTHPQAMQWRHLIPAIGFLILTIATLLALITLWPFLILVTLYLLAITVTSLSLAVRHDWRLFPLIWLSFPAIHLGWGAGFWASALGKCISKKGGD